MSDLFKRQTLDQLCDVPSNIIDVYVIERHIWQSGAGEEAESKKRRRAEPRTVKDFLIDPVRSLLNDVLRQLAAPYDPSTKSNPIGQGWWIQAEFGSGKSHLLSFMGALALGDKKVWDIVNELETKNKKGKRESIYQFYDSGLAKKSTGKSKGIFVAVKTLVGQGGGTIGVSDTGRKLTEYILDAVQEQYHVENGKPISVYPVEVLAERFESELDLYRKPLAKFLKDPKFFDEEQQEDVDHFLDDLRSNKNQMVRRDCGQKLWRFYKECLKTTPDIAMEAEDVLKGMVEILLVQGYEGVFLILDEVSLFMKNRTEEQRLEDAKTLLILSNRLAKVACLPVWTVCAAQQYIESKLATMEHVFGKERLLRVPLLSNENDFYDIVLSRVRTITKPDSIEPYFADYAKGFTWPTAIGMEKFARFFPFYPPAIDVLKAVSYNLTTLRSSVHFMHETLKRQRKVKSNELITLWQMFDDVVSYEEDPSNVSASIAAISAKFNEEWKAYQAAHRIIGQATKGWLKVFSSRCQKIVKTLFLYYIAKVQPNGLSVEEIMNAVMEWKDHDKGQKADIKDNQDHYENLLDELAKDVPQVKKVGKNFVFTPEYGGVDVKDQFEKARSHAENSEVQQRDAWNQLLGLEGWEIKTSLLTIDLARNQKSIFRGIAPAEQKDIEVEWHGRTIKGRAYMRDLLDIASKNQALPPINTPDTDHDFAVFISNRPCGDKVTELAKKIGDSRTLFWTPGHLTPQEKDRLLDFAAYRELVKEYTGHPKRDTAEANEVMTWVSNRLKDEIGSIVKIVTDSYGRGQISATDHSSMSFNCQGELLPILTPLVGHVLDGVYESKEIDFSDASAPFSDAEAIKVINGVVKTGDIPKGTKPNQFTSAADNYGYALSIMKKDGTKQLNTKGNEFVEDLDEWIETQTGQGNQQISVETVCKNFTGVGGPNDKNYGLSRRMIDRYIRHFTKAGDLVMDTFSGSGGTSLASLLEGRAAIAIDRSPAATFITKNYCTPVDASKLRRVFASLLEKVTPEISWLYSTKCDRCDGDATTGFTVYSQVFQCTRCNKKLPLFDCPEAESTTVAGKPKTIAVCPFCLTKGLKEEISTRGEKFGAVPVLVSYLCQSGCRPARSERRHDDPDPKKRRYFAKYDQAKIEEIESRSIPYRVPIGYSMTGFSRYKRDALNYYGVTEVQDIFTKRNRWAIATLLHWSEECSQEPAFRDLARFAVTGCILHLSRMSHHKEGGGGITVGTYRLPQMCKERNALGNFSSKADEIVKAVESGIGSITSPLCISTQSSRRLAGVPSASIDYIFTDPPYSHTVQYGELNYVWEAWLGLDTTWHDDEIIVNEVRGKSDSDWASLMKQVMSECYRVLKPGRWLTLCFHDEEGTWELVQDFMAEVGFIVDKTDSALFIDAGQKSYNQITADKARKRDLVLNFRKPKLLPFTVTKVYGPEDLAKFSPVSDIATFTEFAGQIVRDFLTRHPGSTKDRIYDEAVSRLVSSRSMEAHDFDALLKGVADEVKQPVKQDLFRNKEADLFGSHVQSRWYLKETADQVDHAEQTKEDDAAKRLEKVIRDQLKKNPELEGVHYSDLFEQYIPIHDKPRRLLADWLVEYFIKTASGTWRLPDKEEAKHLAELREAGTLRRIKRFANAVIEGVPVRDKDRPGSDVDLLDWLRQCRRAGLYEQGKAIYEKGGLNSANLTDEQQIEAEDDYRLCVRRGSGEDAKPKRKSRKKQDDDA